MTSAERESTKVFVASGEDFRRGVRTGGFAFWRGVIVGFLAALPIGQLAIAGEILPFVHH